MLTRAFQFASLFALAMQGCAIEPEPAQAQVSTVALASYCPDELLGKAYYGNREVLGRDQLKWFVSGLKERPVYPAAAAQKGQAGVVLVAVAVSAQGTLEGSSVVCSYPASTFETSVLQALRANAYRVYEKDGVAVPYEIAVRFLFSAQEFPTAAR
jgi:TonB family protein